MNTGPTPQPEPEAPAAQEPAVTVAVADTPTFPADPGETPAAESLRPDPQDTPAEDGPAKPRKKGWWSLGR